MNESTLATEARGQITTFILRIALQTQRSWPEAVAIDGAAAEASLQALFRWETAKKHAA